MDMISIKRLKSLLLLRNLAPMNNEDNNDSKSGSELHPIEKSILRALGKNGRWMSIENLVDSTNQSIDQVRRGIEWLKFKNLVSLNYKNSTIISLGPNGQKAAIEGLPERRLVNAVKEGRKTAAAIVESGLLNPNEINAAIAAAKRNQWIEFKQVESPNNKIIVLNTLADKLTDEEKLLHKLSHWQKNINTNNILSSDLAPGERHSFNFLKGRPEYVIEREKKYLEISLSEKGKQLLSNLTLKTDEDQVERQLTSLLITSGKWKDVKFSPLDVVAPVSLKYPGRKHPLTNLIDEVKEIFVGLGFTEIDGPMIQPSFWNFDVLFTPQDHPAREMQDTFYISDVKQTVFAEPGQIKKISRIHKKGWKYKWNIEDARKTVLRTHTTPVTIKYLADNKPKSARIFSIGRVFRNEKVSYKHLSEFNQVEGILTDKHVTLRDLMGLQKEFYGMLGISKIKFWPTFFPYTEPSLQSVIYNDALDKWVEMGGMGILRPEVTEPLGIKTPVLAWGVGLERIAMLRFDLNDVRALYDNKLSWLRSLIRCQL
jgi:phenylalanyl-tRNA synthetase alpha chain